MNITKFVAGLLSVIAACGLTTRTAHAEEPAGKGLKSMAQIVADAHAGVPSISLAQLKQRIAANPKLVLLDVRTKEEFDAGHLKGAAWVERGIVEFMLVRQLPDPDAEIVAYCKVGHRSSLAVKTLRDAGYRNIVSLEGGFDEWAKQGNSFFNYLGELRLVKLQPRSADDPAIQFFEDKTLPR
jgi:rhodanese-related sulfurtransferase